MISLFLLLNLISVPVYYIVCDTLTKMMAIVVKNPAVNAGDIKDSGSTLGLGKSPGGEHGTYSNILAWRIPWTEGPGEQ